MSEGIVIGNLTIPVIKGDKGDKGNTGEIVSISLVLLSPSSTAYAINNGSTTQAQIELGIPKGLSVSTTNINASGELIFTFNDNSTVNVGKVVGKGISEVTVTDDFDFVVTYTDGTSVTACNLEEEILGAINDILESYYTKTEIDNKGFITKEVNNLTNYTLKTNTGSSIELLINNSTYVMTLNLKNSAGTTISTGTIDLPLETMVVGATYDNTNKKIVLTLKNGSTIDVPVADLVSGLQSEITNANKLNADLVDDTSTTHKFTSTSEKNSWNAKYDKPSGGIPSTDMSSGVQASLGKADTALQAHQDISGKEDSSNKVTSIDENSTNTQYPGAKLVYDELVERDEEINQLWNDHPDILDNNALPSGTDLTLQGTGDLKMKVDVVGNSTQETTSTSEGDEYNSPSPEHKQDINNVEGDVEVKGSSKNLIESILTDTNIQSNGIIDTSNEYSLNIVKVIQGQEYVFSGITGQTVLGYFNNIPSIGDTTYNNSRIVKPLNDKTFIAEITGYVAIRSLITDAEVQLEPGSTATSYVPHAENSVTFPLSQGQKLMLGDTLEDDGIHHKREQVVFDGSDDEIWNLGSYNRFDIQIPNFKAPASSVIADILCNRLIKTTKNQVAFEDNKISAADINSSAIIIRIDDTMTTVSELRTYLQENSIIVEYPLAEETIEAYTTAQQTAYNKLKEMQSYYDLTYVVGSSNNAQPILTVQAKKSLKVINDEISNINSRLTLLEE